MVLPWTMDRMTYTKCEAVFAMGDSRSRSVHLVALTYITNSSVLKAQATCVMISALWALFVKISLEYFVVQLYAYLLKVDLKQPGLPTIIKHPKPLSQRSGI